MNATIQIASVLSIALTAIPATAQSWSWTQLAPTTSSSGRCRHAMAYDTTRQRVVLFGGWGFGGSGPGGYLRDTWEWDGTNWTSLTPSTSPYWRSDHAMAYDSARQRLVLFGGFCSPTGYFITFGDTWEWDGNNWTNLAPALSPTARSHHAMAYDSARQRVVLFGGHLGFLGWGVLADTWEWNGTTWTQLAPPASPSARAAHEMAYDASRQRVVLFGGLDNIQTPPVVFGDTWEWDGTNWTQRAPASSPSARSHHAMAYDSARQRVVLVGGSPGGTSADTWEWDGTNWAQWMPPASPSTRSDHAIAYDAAGQTVVLFGGVQGVSIVVLNDTWVSVPPMIVATATAYGAGCGSPALSFVPDPNGRPLLGQVASATIVNAPTSIAAVAVGGSNQSFGPFALPVPLAGIGMPGCDLLQSADILGLGTTPLTPSTLSLSLPIPNVVSLLGAHVYLQAYAFAPAANPLQIIISNGIDWLFGNA